MELSKEQKEKAAKIMADLPEDERKLIEKHLKGSGSRARRKAEDELLGKYPHLIKGTLRFNDKTNKQEGEIKCQHPGCDKTRIVATSDMHQVSMCEDHKKEQAKVRKAERDARVEAILKEKGISLDELKGKTKKS